jgi:hypothetical protein
MVSAAGVAITIQADTFRGQNCGLHLQTHQVSGYLTLGSPKRPYELTSAIIMSVTCSKSCPAQEL